MGGGARFFFLHNVPRIAGAARGFGKYARGESGGAGPTVERVKDHRPRTRTPALRSPSGSLRYLAALWIVGVEDAAQARYRRHFPLCPVL